MSSSRGEDGGGVCGSGGRGAAWLPALEGGTLRVHAPTTGACCRRRSCTQGPSVALLADLRLPSRQRPLCVESSWQCPLALRLAVALPTAAAATRQVASAQNASSMGGPGLHARSKFLIQ